MSALVASWRERIRAAAQVNAPLRIVGGGTKDFYGRELIGERFETAEHRGITDYDPTELVVTARCGTLLVEVEQALAGQRQMLAFEPPHFGEGATLGGCIAAGLSGPRRPYAGAVRDVVLGVRVLDGRGDELRFGGRVMKNVAGFDVSRLVVGSLGTFGVILEASIKCLPQPRLEQTIAVELGADAALGRFAEWSPLPLAISASCWCADRLTLRLSGAESAIAHAAHRIGGETIDASEAGAHWRNVRDHRHAFFGASPGALWRASVRATAPQPAIAAPSMIEWSGALRWFVTDSPHEGALIREWARAHGGHATLFRGGDKSAEIFQPLPDAMMTLHRQLKSGFDPSGIFNPRRMYAEF
ncbi:MAG: glycolate oxidase subunit GlcE [Betaproteobacteria bacterium]